MKVRDEIVWRSALVYFAVVLIAVAIIIRILVLQFIQHGKWTAMSENMFIRRLKCLQTGETS